MDLTKLLKEAQFHGSNRLADPRHRIWWLLVLLLGIWASVNVIYNTVWRYFENPTYITLLPEEVKQPFPAVLICPENFFPKHRINKFLSEIKYPTGTNASRVKKHIIQLAAYYSRDVSYRTKDLMMLESVLDYNKLSVENATERLTSSCEESLIRCHWLGVMKNCSEIFKMELTPGGYCCVFNGRSLRREIREYGIHKAKPHADILVNNINYLNGLVVAVNQSQNKIDLDVFYKWLALDNGQKYVDSAKNGTPLSPSFETWTQFGIQRFKIDDDAKILSSDLRRCHFTGEPLKYFPVYTKSYCMLECEMERILRQCQCLRTFHPQPPGTFYCRALSLLCAKHATVPYGSDHCKCPLTCDTDVDFSIIQSFQLLNNSLTYDNFYSGLDFEKASVVRVFFVSLRSKVFYMRSYYDYYNLFSQLGGIFGLFFGCSVLTILELLQLLWHGICKRSNKVKVNGGGLILPPVGVKRKKTNVFKLKQKNDKKVKFIKVID